MVISKTQFIKYLNKQYNGSNKIWINIQQSKTYNIKDYMMRSFLFKDKIYNKEFSRRSCFSLYVKRGFSHRKCLPLQKLWRFFMTWSFIFNTRTRKFFTTWVVYSFKNQNIMLINPEIIQAELHKCTSNYVGYWYTLFTLEVRYGLIPPCEINIVKPSIKNKPRLRARFGLTMVKYTFTSLPPKLEMKCKAIHGQKLTQIDRWTW